MYTYACMQHLQCGGRDVPNKYKVCFVAACWQHKSVSPCSRIQTHRIQIYVHMYICIYVCRYLYIYEHK